MALKTRQTEENSQLKKRKVKFKERSVVTGTHTSQDKKEYVHVERTAGADIVRGTVAYL